MKPLRRRIIFSILVVMLLVSSFSVTDVSAGWMQCRSDPVVILSNGLVLDLSADIGVFPWQVEQVDYVLHVPEGVSLVASIATPAWPTSIETFTLYDDAPPGVYHAETTVYTSESQASVTAHTILLSPLGVQLDLESVSGVQEEVLHAYLNVP